MSEQHKSTAPDKPTSGGPEDSSAKAGKVEPASPQRESGVLSLDQIKLGIGDTIQLQFQSDVEPSRCFVTLIGYLEGQSVIVTTPIINGSLMLVREGQDFVVRLFSGKTAYAFTSMAKRVTNTPYPHLHLAYPKEVRGLVVRGSSRGRINIICHATAEGAVAMPALRATSASAAHCSPPAKKWATWAARSRSNSASRSATPSMCSYWSARFVR